MSALIEIEHAIEKLPQGDFRQLHRWMAERDEAAWDAEIAADAERGRFDRLREQVRRDYEAGKCTPL